MNTPESMEVREYGWDRQQSMQAVIQSLVEALSAVCGDANRLCDRQLGGTYESDCRLTIGKAKTALLSAKPYLKA